MTIMTYNKRWGTLTALACGCVLLVLNLATAALAGAPAPTGPETIDLKEAFQVEGRKEAVIFPHHLHQAVTACAKCHKNEAGGGELVVSLENLSGTRNDFHTQFCWPCHKAEKVPKGTSCSTCHKKQ